MGVYIMGSKASFLGVFNLQFLFGYYLILILLLLEPLGTH